MRKKIKKSLNRQIPQFLAYPEGKLYFKRLILILALWVNIYQPFGLTQWNEYHKVFVLSFYCVVYCKTYTYVHTIYSRINPPFCKPEHWNIRKQLQMLLIYLPAMACTTMIFAVSCIPEFKFSLADFFRLQLYNVLTLAGIVPLFGFIVSKKIESKNRESPVNSLANTELQPEKQETPVTPKAPTGSDNIISIKNTRLDVTKILFAETKKNTLHVYHIYNEKVQHLEKPITLTEFKELVSGYTFLKICHRSFVVNINYIVSWEGTLEKMTLHLKYTTHTVSVSETYSAEFKELMELLSIPKHK